MNAEKAATSRGGPSVRLLLAGVCACLLLLPSPLSWVLTADSTIPHAPSSERRPCTLFHGREADGTAAAEFRQKGSCWCSDGDGDEYCLCTPALAVDSIVLLRGADGVERMVVGHRLDPPPGLALIGGFVNIGETVEDAAAREILEETSLMTTNVELLTVFSDPTRDYRRHTVSAVFIAEVQGVPKAGDDARDLELMPVASVASQRKSGELEFAFDHGDIVDFFLRSRGLM